MNRVICVDLKEEEVEIRTVEKQKKRKAPDQYDVDDPFFQEDEEVEVDAIECKYENFFCVSGETALQLEKKKEEKKEDVSKIRKEKRENIRHGFVADKEELLASFSEIEESSLAAAVRRLVVLEVLTEQDPAKDRLFAALSPLAAPSTHSRLRALIDAFFSHEELQKVLDETAVQSKGLIEKIKEGVEEEKLRVEEAFPNDSTETKYAKIHIGKSLMENCTLYTECEYLIYFVSLYMGGKKRVLEYPIKKAIFSQIQELFPSTYGSSGSIGKKIASHILKAKHKKGAEHTQATQDRESARAEDDDEAEAEAEEASNRESSQTPAQETQPVDELLSQSLVASDELSQPPTQPEPEPEPTREGPKEEPSSLSQYDTIEL
ncbi:hypothetical protein NEDG_00592 [Nematocida displodere]|uniref:Uncharacterized protein n=1 Tax=Nematocida displodere TaxID=1805483 RepID=A0A177EEN7_9MICR|nr:hypothetical protein NEDG_00592 [Nematocida displodere]